MQYRFPIVLMMLATLLGACGGGSSGSDNSGDNAGDTDGDQNETPSIPVADDAPVMPPLFAITLSQGSDDGLSVDEVNYIAGKADTYRPAAARTGELVAIAYSGESVIEAVPVSFPSSYVSEQFVGNTMEMALVESGTLESATARIFIDATTEPDRIDIVDASQSVLASITDFPSGADSAALRKQPFSDYPWIDLLDETDTHPIITELSASGLWTLSDENIAKLKNALDAMPRRLVSAIDTLGVALLSRPGITYGGHVFLDLDALDFEPGRLLLLLTHEAGHAYHNVSASVAGSSFAEWEAQWPASIISAVRDTHDNLGLDKDVLAFWASLQQSAVNAGISSNYRGADAPALSGTSMLNGFVTDYASERLTDDFADTVVIANFRAIQQLAPAFSSETCSSYQLGLDLGRLRSLAYIKLRLVQQMGLAEDEDVEWCLGDSAPTQTPGIQLGDALFFGQELNAGYTGQDRQQFNVVGQDAEGRGLAIELATEGQAPVGVYPLDLTWWGAWDGSNTLVIASPVDIEARSASSGVVVITHASSEDRVDGFVFDLHLRSALGPASSFDFVPFRIPF